jgi:transposase-like protein
MNKNKKWFLAISVATMIATNGIAMAATTTDQQDTGKTKRPAFATKGEMMQKRAMHGDHSALLSFLKIDAETFKADMKAGKSLVTIAKEHGKSEKQLKDFIIKQMSARIDEGVKAGKLDAERAKELKANMQDRVTDMINGKGQFHAGRGAMKSHPMDHSKLLEFLKTDAQTLKADLKEGKSLVAIAKEHGVSERELKKFMVNQMTERINEGVKAGKISADKAKEMKTNLEERVSQMINGTAPIMIKAHRAGHDGGKWN